MVLKCGPYIDKFDNTVKILRIAQKGGLMLCSIMSNLIMLAALMIFTLCSADAGADIFQYVDKEGITHFTNVSHRGEYKKVITENRSKPGRFEHIIQRKALKYRIDPSIIRAMIKVESGSNPRAVSHKGARGLMQLMPATAKEMNVQNLFSPEESIEGGSRYLRHMLNSFNDNMSLALAAYNAGPSRVRKSRGIPAIPETRKYVKKILNLSQKDTKSSRSQIYKVKQKDGTILFTNIARAN